MLLLRTARYATSLVAALAAFGCPLASAGDDDPSASMFSLGGFGTLEAVHSSEHQADFTASSFNPNGAGFTHNWSTDTDSLVGGQVTANVTPQLSMVLQVISEQNYNNTYWPHVEWADIKYQFTPDFSLRAGRTVLPSFLVSDARNIGYANPWVRPPIEVYSLVPITSSDGIDASYKVQFGNVSHTLVGTFGRSSPNIPLRGSVESRRNWLIADTIEFGAATIHIAYQQSHLTVGYLDRLFDAFREFGPQGNQLANVYDTDNKLATFLGLGATYDPGNWFVTGEWGSTDLHSALGKSTGWYTTGGYRLAKFTPYLTYAQARADNLSDPGLTLTSLPPPFVGAATGLNAALDSVLSTKRVQSTISAGARWDLVKNTDLKLQFDHTRTGAGSAGELINFQPGYQLGGRVNLISISVDFVF
jgi:hypothetical protein